MPTPSATPKVTSAIVAAAVLEFQLTQRAQRGAPILAQAHARVGRQGQQRDGAARVAQRPQRERQRRQAEREDGDHHARREAHGSCSISRRMRSRIAASIGGGIAGRRRVQRVTSTATSAMPSSAATYGTTHTSSVKPRRGGASRIQSPYLSTKYARTCAGDSPAASRSRTIARIWPAISDGESATER